MILDLWIWILFLSAAGSVSWAVIGLAIKIAGKKLTQRWKYYIWLIPVAAFLLPMDLVIMPTYDVNQYFAAADQTNGEIQGASAAAGIQAKKELIVSMEAGPGQVRGAQIGEKQVQSAEPGGKAGAQIIAAYSLWAAVLCGIVLHRLFIKVRFMRRLSALMEPAGEEEQQTLLCLLGEMNIRRRVALKRLNGDSSPFVTGVFRPTIVIPCGVPGKMLSSVLHHELVHVKRGDLVFRGMLKIMTAIHWFNPFAYLAEAAACRFMELSCDEAVCRKLSMEQRRQYGISILTLMKDNGNFMPESAFFSKQGFGIKKRMENIMTPVTYKRKTVLLAAVLSMLLIGSTVLAAAAVSTGNPVKEGYGSYHLKDQGETWISSAKNGIGDESQGESHETWRSRDITLVNTPLKKSFNAKLIKSETAGGDIMEVRMDSLDRVLNDGNDWVGKFTVTRDGKALMKQVTGTISNVPSDRTERLTQLYAGDKTKDGMLNLPAMNFNLIGEDLLIGSKQRDDMRKAFEKDKATKSVSLSSLEQFSLPKEFSDLTFKGSEDMVRAPFQYNRDLKKLDFEITARGSRFWISSDLEEDYSFNGDQAEGRFCIRQLGGERIFEFNGILSGLSGKPGDRIVLRSKDGSCEVSAVIGVQGPAEEMANLYDWKGPFSNEQSRITTSEFPFQVQMNADKASVTLTGKEMENYEGWRLTIATYNKSPRPNIWEERFSKDGENTFIFPLLSDGSEHYINLTGFNSQGKAELIRYELGFTVVNGELFYRSGSKGVMEAPADGREKALDLLRQVYSIDKML